jgi:hypothetical protein
MHGIDLLEMDMPPMLDIIHYVFEEDMTPQFVEKPAQAKSRVRSSLYETLYDRPYKSAISDGDDNSEYSSTETKPYIPPTDPEDFDKVLGAPMGG